ncbi:MAG: hypothetical protein V4564_23475 [Pseudomonadota bacterium]|uniref:hypothetical protein n=1 Tax=Sphingomonas sp. ERG5 TaxID=1381597 RepID=UPI00054C23D6|nr:hypothetical protein [Sphingomonas sp. ERG5]
MRSLLLMTAPLALAGCGQTPNDRQAQPMRVESMPAMPVDSPPDRAFAPSASVSMPPSVAVTAAPGVAFTYRYAFRLPSERISATQEAHVAACEKLGIARCRITGMRYRLLGENNIEAMLSFKLDPAVARRFGKDGIALVTAAQGRLVDAEIAGTDAGAAIDQLTVQHSRATDELRRINAELARPKLSASERAELQRQRAEILRNISATVDSRAEQRESLATTPMTFTYESGKAIRGFDASAPLSSALDTGIGSVQITIAVVLGAIAIFGPPGLILLFGWLVWRRFRPRRSPGPVKADGETST